MNFYKNLTISLITAVLTMGLSYGGYTIYAQQAEVSGYLDFNDPSSSFSQIQGAYHLSMNRYFNDKVERLVEILDEENFYDNPDFNAPLGDVCPETNVSSYCVSMGALELYVTYVETLNQMKGYLPTGELPPGGTAEDLLRLNNQRDDDIDLEVEDAKVVMQMAVSVYDEFRLAYPMHQKYRTIIGSLLKYKISLSKITNEVEQFPLKFIDATSAICR